MLKRHTSGISRTYAKTKKQKEKRKKIVKSLGSSKRTQTTDIFVVSTVCSC